jgi:hypothetical protein
LPNGQPGAGNVPPQRGDPTAPDEAHKKRAGDLQLEEFRKRVTKEMLQKYNISQEEWDNHLRAEAERRKKDSEAPPSDPSKDDTKAGNRGGSSRVNAGVTRAQAQPGKAGDLNRGAGTKAPPEYSSASEKFSEFLAKPRTPKPGEK